MGLIELEDVVKRYETPAGSGDALRGVSLRVDGGEFVAVIGKSGSGKSTLANMITGIDRPTTGRVVVAGTSVHDLSEGDTAQWRGRTVGVVFQFFQLLPTLSLLDNVVLPMEFCREDECVEVTPVAVRLRKVVLDQTTRGRETARRKHQT